MATVYKVPMSKTVLTLFLIVVAIITATVVWCFKSGLTWSAICLIAVAGPLSIFYWYMLYITPKRAVITVADEGILLAAPPFASAVIPWASVTKVFAGNLKTDDTLKIRKSKKFMNFAGYRCGVVELENASEAVMVTNSNNVHCIQTEDRLYLLGPSDLEQFVQEVDSIFNK